MKLVEVVAAPETDPAIMKQLAALVEGLGKTAVEVRDSPGFLVNRCARPFYGEALKLLEDGVADAATIDACLRSSGGFPLGPLELIDLVGIDINLHATRAVWSAFGQVAALQAFADTRRYGGKGNIGTKNRLGLFHLSA